MKGFDLENRLITFAVKILEIADELPKTYAGLHLSKQITRSGTSPALNYAEALGAESKKDFVHKMKISLKELRETNTCLKIIDKKPLLQKSDNLTYISKECIELISIFVSSIKTASKKF